MINQSTANNGSYRACCNCSEKFYDQHGHERRYFYYIDLQVLFSVLL